MFFTKGATVPSSMILALQRDDFGEPRRILVLDYDLNVLRSAPFLPSDEVLDKCLSDMKIYVKVDYYVKEDGVWYNKEATRKPLFVEYSDVFN